MSEWTGNSAKPGEEKNHTQGVSLRGKQDFHWQSQEILMERGHLPRALKDEWDSIR